MCGSQYSSLLKISENIKGKFEDSLDCLCMRGTSAPWSVVPRRVISAPHITAPTPRVYFFQKLEKWHICEIISRKGLNCKKNLPAAPQPGGLGGRPASCRAAGSQGPVCNLFSSFFADKPLLPGSRAARSRPPGSGAAGVYFCKFLYRKYFF